MKTKAIKVRLEKTTRTDLMCIACGNFQTEFAVVCHGDESNFVAGVHRICINSVHVRRQKTAPR